MKRMHSPNNRGEEHELKAREELWEKLVRDKTWIHAIGECLFLDRRMLSTKKRP